MKYFFGKIKKYRRSFEGHHSFFAVKPKLQPQTYEDVTLPDIESAKVFNSNENLDNLSYWIFLGFSILICLYGIYMTRNYLMDDALITLRYSFNFAKQGIPIWNQADLENPSMGYTSFLWMAINAIPALFTSNKDFLVMVAQFFSFASLIAIVVVISKVIFSSLTSTLLKYLTSFAIFLQFGYGLHVNSAMETLLFSSLLLLAVKAYADAQFGVAYFYGVLLFLTRPEGAILVGVILIWDLINRRFTNALVGGIVFSFVVAGTLAVQYFWYGDIVPNTFYAKQEILNIEALVRTVFFVTTVALPFLIMSIHAVIIQKNKTSRYMFIAAIVYIFYYLTVDPVMNVMSRYQWPSLVLLTYASVPTLEYLCVKTKRKRRKVTVAILVLMLATINVGNALGASYFADAEGHAMGNLIMIGKKMAGYRDPEKWLVYHDAGAICYFSDWNTHEIIGLTNRLIATGQIRPVDIYNNPNAQIVLRNFDLMSEGQETGKLEFTKMLSQYGFLHVQDIPILSVMNQRNFVVAVYAKDTNFASAVFQDVTVNPPLQPNQAYVFYKFAREIVRGR